jgi:DNA-binding Lrp family transcriptional regulator
VGHATPRPRFVADAYQLAGIAKAGLQAALQSGTIAVITNNIIGGGIDRQQMLLDDFCGDEGLAMANLDQIDRRLLAELQDEGRVTNVELANRVGLTAPPCLRRVRALEDDGVIKGYHAELDASKLGFAITVFALVSLKSQAEESLRQFEEHMRTLPEVRECHMLNGEIDFILKIVSRDLQSFQEFLTSKLTPAPNVASVKTSLTIRTAKQLPGVPLE